MYVSLKSEWSLSNWQIFDRRVWEVLILLNFTAIIQRKNVGKLHLAKSLFLFICSLNLNFAVSPKDYWSAAKNNLTNNYI